MMKVIIGIDPHKASHTAVAIDDHENELSSLQVRANKKQTSPLLEWAGGFDDRLWAIESAGGWGYLLGQQLLDAGETVVDVPATLAARVRLLGTGRSNKNDPNDALSVAVAAFRAPALTPVRCADHASVLAVLAARNKQLAASGTRTVTDTEASISCTSVPATSVDRFARYPPRPKGREEGRPFAAETLRVPVPGRARLARWGS